MSRSDITIEGEENERKEDFASEVRSEREFLAGLIERQIQAVEGLNRELANLGEELENTEDINDIKKEMINLLMAMVDLERKKAVLERCEDSPSGIEDFDDLNGQLDKRFSFDSKDPQSSKENLQKIMDFVDKNLPKELLNPAAGLENLTLFAQSLKDSDLIALYRLVGKNENLASLIESESDTLLSGGNLRDINTLSLKDPSNRGLLQKAEKVRSCMRAISSVLGQESERRKFFEPTSSEKMLFDQLKTDPQQRERFVGGIRETIKVERERANRIRSEQQDDRQAISHLAAVFDKINDTLLQLFELSGGQKEKDRGIYEMVPQLTVFPTSSDLSDRISYDGTINQISDWLERKVQ